MRKNFSIRFMIIYTIFVFSGSAALVYQIIWFRWLGLVFGNTTISVSIVLGSFMLGLALGSWLVGQFLHRIENPLKMYAVMEFGIGLFALYFSRFATLVDILFTLLVSTESPDTYQLLMKTMCSVLLLLIPTTLMGATLPLLTEFFRRSPHHTFSWKVGLLYAANTLGAAAGTFVVSFFMIEAFGVSLTTIIAADINIAIAAIAFLYARKSELLARDTGTDFPQRLKPIGMLALSILAASGATALASEVLWTRTIESLVGNSTYAFATIVIVYLLGIALGSWIMSLLVNRLSALSAWLAGMLVGMGIWTVIAIFLFDGIIDSLSPYRGQLIPLTIILTGYLRAVAILIPLSLLSGACFPIATRIIDPLGEDARGTLIARAYAWNTVGALLGSLVAGFIIAPLFDYLASLYALAVLYSLSALAVVAVIMLPAFRGICRRPAAIAIGTVSVVLLLVSTARLTDTTYYKRRLESKFPTIEVVSHRPGLQGVTTVLKRKGAPLADVLLVNGIGMTRKITDTKMMAHLPMLFHPNPSDTLVICFGMGTTYRSAVSYGGKVTVVELVKEVFDAFPFFHGDAERVLAYPNQKMVVNDGRIFLKLTEERYDVITIDPPPPIDAAGVNHLYSREFVELARSRLKPGGIMAHWIPFPGQSAAGVDDWKTFNLLVATFLGVFPHTYAQRGFYGFGLHVLGAMEPLSVPPEHLLQRINNEQVKKDLNEWDVVPLQYFRSVKLLPEDTRSIPRITDDMPLLEFYLLRTWKEGGRKMLTNHFW